MNTKMNKLAVALASAIALGGFGANAYAASDTAAATATVITPIAITKVTDLAFGKFSALTGGSIKVDTNNAISVTGAVKNGTGSTGTAAKFNVTGDGANTYSITHSGSAVLTDGTNTMALAKVSALTAAAGTETQVTSGTLTEGAQSIYVGGTLTVASGQPAGAYTGDVTVTVEYN